jgi:DNA polymerase I-like protein with 3'-5' exonuclease and polymerase domains
VKIFSDSGGKLVDRPYRLFEPNDLLYRLPARNIGWRSIRRVRTASEEAQYHGFDTMARSLFNHIAQAGTSDVVKSMMIRAMPTAERFSARLLLQIHDELLFEAPLDRVEEFIPTMRAELERPPDPTWRVPIVVDASRGGRFGDLAKVKAK